MAHEPPFCSVIIPTHNRPKKIAETLESIARLDYPRDRFEVIVVQDGGDADLEPVVAPFRDALPVTFIRQPQAGPAAARNTGVSRARGDLLVFTDDDCRPRAHWLGALADRWAASPDRAVGGRTVNALVDNVYSTASQLLVDYLYLYYNGDADRARFLTSNNLAVPAARFAAVGRFDPAFPSAAAEDRDLCDRWLQRGDRLVYAPEAVIEHVHALSFSRFWRQHFTYGRGACAFHRARAQRGGGPIRVEPLRFYVDLVLFPFTQSKGLSALPLAMLMLVSQIANSAGFVWARLQPRRA